MLLMSVLSSRWLLHAGKCKEQIDQRIRDNERTIAADTVSEIISHGKKRCKNSSRLNRN
jgi:hypothetical protein